MSNCENCERKAGKVIYTTLVNGTWMCIDCGKDIYHQRVNDNWEDDFEIKFNNGDFCWNGTPGNTISQKRIKDYFSGVISEEKEKMVKIVEENIPKPSPENPNVDEPYYKIISLLQDK